MFQQTIGIVGAGIVGLATAYALLLEGNRHVTVLEQETVDHRRGTSHGISRLLRFEYGDNAFYSEMVRLSLKRWRALEQYTQRRLYTRTGLLTLGTAEDQFALPSYTILREMGLPTERLTLHDCQQRFPQFAPCTYDLATYNAEAGILHASSCLQALKKLVFELGGKIYEGKRVTHIINDSLSRPIRLITHTGNEISIDRLVLTTGPWVHKLLGELRLPVQLTRQYLLYFAGLSPSLFGIGAFPAFISNELYGFPLQRMSDGQGQGSYWFKAASHEFGTLVDPDEILPQEERVIARIAYKLRELLPALQHAELAHVDSCMYDVTPDEDFILDRMPHDPRVVFATGLSGHGFKFGLLLGELLSSMICGMSPAVSLERFRLARFGTRQRQPLPAGISSVA